MAFIRNASLDALLADVNDATRLDICNAEPTTYGQATTKDTYSLGYKTGLTVGAPGDAGVLGRKVIVPQIADGTVDCTGTDDATHWALTNGSDTLYATGSLAASQAVTDGNSFTLAAFDIIVPDAVDES